jgi:hypothetical protein
MNKSTLKSIFSILAITGGAVLMIYAAHTGFERQACIDCLNASRICEDFRDVHKGKCAECRLVDYCIKNNII